MIIKVHNIRELRKFVYFTDCHYARDNLFVPPIYRIFLKELKKQVLERERYTALLATDGKIITGRLLYTTDESKQRKEQIGYFSNFECVDDGKFAWELFTFMEQDLKRRGITYVEGGYCPYDPDTRRGILVKGFDRSPTLFTSYNYPYYGRILEDNGYSKAYDTFSLQLELQGEKAEILSVMAGKVREKFDVRVDNLNYKNFDCDIADIATVLRAATTELNYQEAPSEEKLRKLAKSMRLFLEPAFIKIARENHTNKPIGFCMSLPDFNQVIKQTNGRLRPLKFLTGKKHITAARGMLQYIIPEYQGAGIISLIFDETYASFLTHGIEYFEGGTILEENKRSWGVLEKFGGKIVKIYRIYGKELKMTE